MRDEATRLSKFLSWVLRHRPQAIGLQLGAQGWVEVDELIRLSHAAGTRFDREQLLAVVRDNDKQRFTLSADGLRIRAAQGHSVAVELDLQPCTPPQCLFHGTAAHSVQSILAQGLQPRSRQQVHLSADQHTARKVGQRHGVPVVLHVAALKMHDAGHPFFQADNGVWLTDQVPPDFIHPLPSVPD